MSLIRRNPHEKEKITLIPLQRAADMLNLNESTVRQRKAGTESLTHVRQGHGKKQRISVILEEVEAHIESLVAFAREHNPGNSAHVKRGRIK